MKTKAAILLISVVLVAACLAAMLYARQGKAPGATEKAVSREIVQSNKSSVASEPTSAAEDTTEVVPGLKDEMDSVAKTESEETSEADALSGWILVRVYGVVTDAKTGAPVANAEIRTPKYEFEMALAVSEETAVQDREQLGEEVGKAKDSGAQTFPPGSVITEEDGSFEILVNVDEEDPVMLSCLAEGYAKAEREVSEPETVSQAQKSESHEPVAKVRLDFQLTEGAGIEGRVVDRLTQQGIKNVTVYANDAQQQFPAFGFMDNNRLAGKTNEDGIYQVDGLQAGAYRITVEPGKSGYIFKMQDAPIINVETGNIYESVDFQLDRGAEVRGLVSDSQGTPVANAALSLIPGGGLDFNNMSSWQMYDNRIGVSADDGKYSIVGLEFGREFRIRANADGYASAATQSFSIEDGQSPLTLNITLNIGSRVMGVARYASAAPAKAVKLSLMPNFGNIFQGDFSAPLSATTGDDGTFGFEHVPAGKYTLHEENAMAFNPFSSQNEPKTIEVDGIHDLTGVEFTVANEKKTDTENQQATGTIEGTVLDQQGAPASGVRVEAKDVNNPMSTSGASTAEDGTFAIKRLPGNAYDLSVICDKGIAQERGVAVGSKVALRLAPASTVRGRVVTATGEADAGCTVQLKEQKADAEGTGMWDVVGNMFDFGGEGHVTDVNGYFEFKNVSPGSYEVTAKSRSNGTGKSDVFQVESGKDITNLKIILSPGVEFSGAVEETNGAPVSGAEITLMKASDNAVQDMMTQFMPTGLGQADGIATSDMDGRFAILNLPPATYHVSAKHPNYAAYSARAVEVPSGHGVTNYRIVLSPGGRVIGHVVFGGAPKAGIMVQIIGSSGGGFQMATTDSSGAFEFDKVPPGAYMLVVTDMGNMSSFDLSAMRQIQRAIDVVEGETVVVDLTSESGTPVHGVITGMDPNAMTQVTLRRPGGPAPEDIDPLDMAQSVEAMRYSAGQAMVGRDGTFSMENIEPGTYILEVFSVVIDMQNPDMDALMNMDRTPQIRQEITIGEEQLDLNLDLSQALMAQ